METAFQREKEGKTLWNTVILLFTSTSLPRADKICLNKIQLEKMMKFEMLSLTKRQLKTVFTI